jgi:hypothetical protein
VPLGSNSSGGMGSGDGGGGVRCANLRNLWNVLNKRAVLLLLNNI